MVLAVKVRSNRVARRIAQHYCDAGIACDTQPNSGADARWPGDLKSALDLSEVKTSKRVDAHGDGILYVTRADWDQIVAEAGRVGLLPALHTQHFGDRVVWTVFQNTPFLSQVWAIWDVTMRLTPKGNVRQALGNLLPGVLVAIPGWDAYLTDLPTYLRYLGMLRDD